MKIKVKDLTGNPTIVWVETPRTRKIRNFVDTLSPIWETTK